MKQKRIPRDKRTEEKKRENVNKNKTKLPINVAKMTVLSERETRSC
jgi:hypothetical protein